MSIKSLEHRINQLEIRAAEKMKVSFEVLKVNTSLNHCLVDRGYLITMGVDLTGLSKSSRHNVWSLTMGTPTKSHTTHGVTISKAVSAFEAWVKS